MIMLLSSTLLFFLYSMSFGSAWIRQEKELFIAPSINFYTADSYYNKKGKELPIGCKFKKTEVSVYGEYGITKKSTLTFKLPYAHLECGKDKTSGLGDIEIGFIGNINKTEKSSFSYYGLITIPTGYAITDNPRLGYGRVGVEGGLLYGISGSIGFVDSGLGYRHYFGYPSSQVRGYVTFGYRLNKAIELYSMLDAQIGLGNGERKTIGQNILLEPDYKLFQLYIGPRLNFDKRSLLINYNRVLWGRNTGKGQGVSVSIWYDF